MMSDALMVATGVMFDG